MSFTTPTFLFLFLPLSLLLYQFIPVKLKNNFILLVSIAFYGWSEWSFLPIILAMVILNWCLGQLIVKYKKTSGLFLTLGILTSVGLLIYSRSTVLHLGLSFFTFHSLSYLIDIYSGRAGGASLVNTGVYLLFFPQVASGPINKYSVMADQLSSHEVIPSVMGGAIARFIVGLTQKMLLANTFGLLADQIFGLSSLDLSFASAWIGLVAYTLQIYFDFAGYSNMAIGIGSLFGFKLTENFNLPYTALSIGEFWEKWHMSLTGWLRQYIYFPLGGNRKGVLRTYLNIAVVFLVSGIWHGVGWNFVLWGLWHGLFMIIEKWRGWTKPGHIYTMFVVMIGWVFFRSPGLTSAINYLYALVPTGESMVSKIYWLNYLTPYTTAVFVLGILLAGGFRVKLPAKLAFLKPLSLAILFLISLLSVAGSTYNSFIYFKF